MNSFLHTPFASINEVTMVLILSTSLPDWRFVAIDLPGHGFSSHRPDGCFYTFPLYVADVRRVVEGLKPLRAFVTNR